MKPTSRDGRKHSAKIPRRALGKLILGRRLTKDGRMKRITSGRLRKTPRIENGDSQQTITATPPWILIEIESVKPFFANLVASDRITVSAFGGRCFIKPGMYQASTKEIANRAAVAFAFRELRNELFERITSNPDNPQVW